MLSNGHISSNNSKLEVIVLVIMIYGLKGVTITLGGIIDGGNSLALKLGRSA